MKNVELSVIVPTYNDSANLMHMSEALSLYLDMIIGAGRWQYVIVSNGCNDNTSEVTDRILGSWPNTLSLRLDKPDYGNALREGLNRAEGEWAYIINVDYWDPVFLSWAWRHRDSYDMFVGSKRGDPSLDMRPKYRKILTWGLNVLLQVFFGVVVTDTHGQKLLNLKSMRPILDDCVMRRGQFDTEFVIRGQRKGLRLAELPVPVRENRKQRNLMLKKIVQNFTDIFRLKMVIKKVPTCRGIHYHRFSRFDLGSQDSDLPLLTTPRQETDDSLLK